MFILSFRIYFKHILNVIIEIMSKEEFIRLNEEIISCKKCHRLVEFRQKIAKERRKEFFDQNYWGKGVPGFGEKNAKLLILGLAPAAHGANRTGRVFTGDRSASFLFNCLKKANFSNNSDSKFLNDGLKVYNTYITCAIKCVPPGDKPLNDELKNCFGYFKSEFEILKNLKIIVALGKIAFDTCVKFYRENFNYNERVKFGHGSYFKLPNDVLLMGCYHPSPRNVNTGRINEKQMTQLFKKVKQLV